MPLFASVEGRHNASGLRAGGVWFPAQHLVPQEEIKNRSLVWHLEWPQYIINWLVTSSDTNVTTSNYFHDLELAGILLHLEAPAQSLDIREQTVLRKTNNLDILSWQHKDSTTAINVPAHLLYLLSIHQHFHK